MYSILSFSGQQMRKTCFYTKEERNLVMSPREMGMMEIGAVAETPLRTLGRWNVGRANMQTHPWHKQEELFTHLKV